MPLYSYQCPTCKTVVEVVQKITEKSSPVCEKCPGQQIMESLIQGGTFILKGHGWARDGYRSKK